MRVLDLFSGLEGWSTVWKERGHVVTTLDLDPRFGADWVVDVREFAKAVHHGQWDVVLASPPCELFSTGGWHQHAWSGPPDYEPLNDKATTALELVQATVDIVTMVEPEAAVVENPRGLLRKLGVLPETTRRTVWYCHYGENRAKPTDLWTYGEALKIKFLPECHNRRPGHPDGCCCTDHAAAPRGSVTGTQGMDTALAAKIPDHLAYSVMIQLERAHYRGGGGV